MTAAFLRLIEREDKAAALLEAIRARDSGLRFDVDPQSFGAVERSPFAYWVGDRVRRLFQVLPSFESGDRTAKVGLQTSDDFRFVRLATEVAPPTHGARWFPFAKGGRFSRFYSDVHLLLNWADEGIQMKAWAGSLYNNSHWSRILKNVDFFFRPGLTWPRRTQGGLSIRAMPEGCIFADKGPAAFVENDDPTGLLAYLAIFNSRPFGGLVELQMAFGSYEVGVLQRTPIPRLSASVRQELAGHARRAWSIQRGFDTSIETSHAFMLPALLQVEGLGLSERADAWAARLKTSEEHLAGVQQNVDELCSELYGIADEDKRRIQRGFDSAIDDAERDDADDEPEAEEDKTGPLAGALLSWALGVAFGRFDLRLATSDREPRSEPEPFDPLPVCSPGMLTGDSGLPLEAPRLDYPVHFPPDGILADDPGHDRDLVARAHQVFELVFGGEAEAMWPEAAEIADPRSHDLRSWFARSFFEGHIKRYSKSRRKAPIYWQLSTPSASYSIWLYLHRTTKDTFYKVLNDFVEPKLRHEEKKLANLMQAAGGHPTSGHRKEIDSQVRFVEELRTFRDEVARIAPLWNPDLNDGVIINFAPLWRLVPQHRAWQKECKKVWDKLCKGDYDWSHLAMHLWPGRVVPKCAKDRSLAIAHGLEDVFWDEESGGKWKPRKVDQAAVERLINERTSTAVKDALKSILSAPAPARPRKNSQEFITLG